MIRIQMIRVAHFRYGLGTPFAFNQAAGLVKNRFFPAPPGSTASLKT